MQARIKDNCQTIWLILQNISTSDFKPFPLFFQRKKSKKIIIHTYFFYAWYLVGHLKIIRITCNGQIFWVNLNIINRNAFMHLRVLSNLKLLLQLLLYHLRTEHWLYIKHIMILFPLTPINNILIPSIPTILKSPFHIKLQCIVHIFSHPIILKPKMYKLQQYKI